MPVQVEIHNAPIVEHDPLRYREPLPFGARLFPMGFPLRISTNSESVLRAAEEVWGWCPNRSGGEPLDVRIAVEADSGGERPPARLPTGRGHLLSFAHSADNFIVSDLSRGFAYGWLTDSVVSDAAYFRFHFLEPVVYTMLGSWYLAPVHAACIELEGAGILLCGDSGAGKTSLAYACARRGWTYVSDDASHVVRNEPGRRIIGQPHYIRFRSSATELFPELANHAAEVRPNGKLDIQVPTADLGLPATAGEVRADYLIFLRRSAEGPAQLREFPAREAARWLHSVLCIGEDDVREAQKRTLNTLLEIPIIEMSYSDLDEAERCLRYLVRSGA